MQNSGSDTCKYLWGGTNSAWGESWVEASGVGMWQGPLLWLEAVPVSWAPAGQGMCLYLSPMVSQDLRRHWMENLPGSSTPWSVCLCSMAHSALSARSARSCCSGWRLLTGVTAQPGHAAPPWAPWPPAEIAMGQQGSRVFLWMPRASQIHFGCSTVCWDVLPRKYGGTGTSFHISLHELHEPNKQTCRSKKEKTWGLWLTQRVRDNCSVLQAACDQPFKKYKPFVAHLIVSKWQYWAFIQIRAD